MSEETRAVAPTPSGGEEVARLRELVERLALITEGANDGLWDWDLRGGRVHYSERFQALAGNAPLEEGIEAWFSRVHPEDRSRLQADIDTHLDGRVARFFSEHRLRHPDGREVWVMARGMARRDPQGRAVRMAGSLTDITDRKAAEALLAHQAAHDSLTGLPNRGALLDRLERSLSRAHHRAQYRFAVLFLDIDRFKLVNDSLGHMMGDLLLVDFARRLTTSLRPSDMVAHLGGDEFAVLADHVPGPSEALHIAERVRAALAEPFLVGGQEVFATACAGIALSAPHYQRPEEMLRDADTAMYRAKAGGTARYEIFDADMHHRASERLKLETDLRRATERGEMRLHYQPIVDLATGAIAGFEALLRWQHPERGLVFPGHFVPIAEETGLIVPIGAWVVRQACHQVRAWQLRFPGRPLTIAVNLTSNHFTQADVRRGVEEALAESGLPGRDLQLEITESVMMENLDQVVAVLNGLKGLSVSLHIDDFGTGYSSLSYLHSLPTDALKIDRSFVARMGDGIGGEVEDGTIVRTIVEMAHNLGRHVVAEGVETAHQLARLRALGCEFGQGYYFARPLPPEQAEALLEKDPRWT